MAQAAIVRLSITEDSTSSLTAENPGKNNGFTKDLLELALRSSGDSVWYWNVETGEIKLDDSWIEKLGYDPTTFKFSFEWWNNSIDQQSISVFDKALSDYLDGRKSHYEIEYQIRTKSGMWIWVWALGKCIEYKKDGTPLKFIGTHRDVTRNKENEKKLLELTENLELKVKERTEQLQKALSEIKTLRGIIPICSYCHKIRDDAGSWSQLEKYLCEHSDAAFSHGICPDCYEKVKDDF
jgi:PAS domain S-box-containing protein